MEENVDVSVLKVADLKKLLKEKGLSTTGNKMKLLERLQTNEQEPVLETDNNGSVAATDESQENVETDLLGGDDSFLLDESPNKAEKPTEIVEDVHKTTSSGVVINKIVFNTDVEEHEETLKKRAEKFGLNSEESKKDSRAKRFGTIAAPADNKTNTKDTHVSTPKVTSPVQNKTEQMDKLKKRAERFGMVVSDTLSQIDSLERKKRRKERFGEILVSSTKSNVSDDERIKMREERFGALDKKTERAKRFGLT